MKRLVLGLSVSLLTPAFAWADVEAGLSLLEEGNAQDAAAEFQAAYEAGDGDGAFYLGRMFEMGVGAEPDGNRAANLYAAGVEKGSTLSMNRLGLMYLEGSVLLRDYAEGARLFCQAADAGDVNGDLNCGVSYQLGRGVDQDMTKAIEYLDKAAAQDNIAAQNILGQIYLAGEGADADPEKAIGYFETTADQGNALGLFELAKYYSNPETPEDMIDLPLAYSYANLAAVRGLGDAAQLRDQLEGRMSSEEIEAGQALSKSWTEERIQANEGDQEGEASETEEEAAQ